MIAFKRGRIEVRAVDASGVHDGFSARARNEYRQFASSVGADGTAAVAWTNDEVGGGNERGTGTVWVRIRAAGRSRFSAPVRVTAQGAVRQLDVDVGPGGEVELIYAFWDPARNHHVIHHIYISESGLPGAGSTVATTDAGIAFLLRVLAAGPGASRVVYDSGDGYAERAVWRSRTSVTQWGDSQRLERDSADDFAAVEHLGAGGAAMAYERGGRVLLRVAAPNEPFGEPRVAGDVPQRWLADRTSIASNARGDILVAWGGVHRRNDSFVRRGQLFWSNSGRNYFRRSTIRSN